MGTIGIQGTLLKLLMNMYSESSYRIKCNGEYSSAIPCKLGVKQGCNLSPLLFNLFINDIHSIFDPTCEAVSVNENKFNSLSFADDLVLLSESRTGLQHCLDKLEKYCFDWGLKVNLSKTKVVVFNKSFTKSIKSLNFSIDGQPIEVTKSYTYLGIDISSTGSFCKALDSLYKKSLRALFSIYASLNVYSDGSSIPLFLKLFDALVKPVLLYGSEIWGHITFNKKTNNPLEKLVNKFHKILLGVPNYCSTIGTHVELGRFPASVDIKYSMLKYFCRIVTLPKSRLVSHCYWSLFNLKNVNDQWLLSVKEIIQSAGQRTFNFLWNSQKSLFQVDTRLISKCQAQALVTFKQQFLSTAVNTMAEQSKLQHFREAKTEFKISNYLNTIVIRNSRSLLCKLRLGVLKLEVETGRKFGLVRAERSCKLCNSDQIEDEMHFLFSCDTLEETRQTYLNPLYTKCPQLQNVSHLDKLMYLFFNENLDEDELSLASTLLLKLNNARNQLLLTT